MVQMLMPPSLNSLTRASEAYMLLASLNQTSCWRPSSS
jgi:hypothetical protein